MSSRSDKADRRVSEVMDVIEKERAEQWVTAVAGPRDTPPTVEELRKRRAPAAVKAAMGCVEAHEDLTRLQRLFENKGEWFNDSDAAEFAILVAMDAKRDAFRKGIAALEDIGRELDE